MKGFLNASVLIGKDIVVTNVGIENGKIVAIGSDIEISQPFEIPNSAIVLPGFIDNTFTAQGVAMLWIKMFRLSLLFQSRLQWKERLRF